MLRISLYTVYIENYLHYYYWQNCCLIISIHFNVHKESYCWPSFITGGIDLYGLKGLILHTEKEKKVVNSIGHLGREWSL